MTDMMRQNLVFAGLVALAALIAGAFLALVILRPVRSLSKATKMIEADDLSARVPRGYGDELGQLGSSFNSMAERIETQASKLEAANKELEAFSYSVSHDLRAPLRHINAYGHMLLEDYGEKLDDEAREYLEQIRASSHEMANLIDQVLELAKISRREIVPTAVDVTAMAEKAIRRLQKEAPERVVEVSIEPGMQANGDETLLKQVFENLIANAWKFTGKTENARITVGTESKDSSKVYLVRDNGAGFDMRYAANLFGAFQRLHAADEFEGTGIGLATVHRIITRHGGRIWAESEIKKGSTFYFELNNANSNANQASTRTVLKKRH